MGYNIYGATLVQYFVKNIDRIDKMRSDISSSHLRCSMLSAVAPLAALHAVQSTIGLPEVKKKKRPRGKLGTTWFGEPVVRYLVWIFIT